MQPPRIDTEHLYGRRESGGRGLAQQKLTCKTITIGFKKYTQQKIEWYS